MKVSFFCRRAVLFSVALLLCATGFALAAAQGESRPRIAVLLRAVGNPYWAMVERGVRDAGRDLNVDLQVQGVESDTATETQLTAAEAMLVRKPQALIVSAATPVNLLPALRRAAAENVKIVNLDGGFDLALMQRESIPVAFSIASDNYRAGTQAANYLAQKRAGGKVLIIEGQPGSLPGMGRVQGFRETLKKSGKPFQIIASLPGNWDRMKGSEITADVLTAHPDLAVIYAVNDLMALGAVESVYTAGKGSQVFVIGLDGIGDAVQAIHAGRLQASVAQIPYRLGYDSVAQTVKLLRGEAVEKQQYVETLVLDKEVLANPANPALKDILK